MSLLHCLLKYEHMYSTFNMKFIDSAMTAAHKKLTCQYYVVCKQVSPIVGVGIRMEYDKKAAFDT